MSPRELGHRMLRAGAGAGKTTTLVATFIAFVKDFRARNNGEFPRIVVTTFTRKATQEVKERLLRKSLELGEDDIFRYIGERSRVHLSTIHGVLAVFLARFGDRIGLLPDFTIAGEQELGWLSKRELRRVLTSEERFLPLLEGYDFQELWLALEDWKEADSLASDVRFADGVFFRERTMRLVNRFFEDAAWLAANIPGSSKNATWISWGEMLGGFTQVPQTDDEIAKFLGWIAEIDESFGRKPQAKAGKSLLVDEGIASRNQAFRDDVWDVLADREKSIRFHPDFWRRHDERCGLFQDLAVRFRDQTERARREKSFLSMGDLERLSLELARKDPEAAAAFSKEWDYWMIDEYQDTSPVQVELLRALVGESPHFVVGDPQQSIYFFRGARSQVFHDKMAEFRERSDGALVEEISVNRRSRKPLLEFFNDFFRPNEAFSPMDPQSAKPALGPEIPAAEFRWLEKSDDKDASVTAVIERIQELLKAGAKAESICVLSRKNDVLKAIQDEARRHGVPVQLHTAGGFGRRREIRDSLAFLRFLLNPADNHNLLVLLRSPWFHLPDEEIISFCSSQTISYWAEALRHLPPDQPRHPVRRLQLWLAEASTRGLSETLRDFYRRDGIIDSASLADPSGRREANLWKLLSQLEKAQRQPGFNGLGFLRNLDASLSTEEGNEDGDAVPAIEPKRVQLMTVHASKGLEFDHVIVSHAHGQRPSETIETFLFSESEHLWTLAEKDLTGKRVGSLLAQEILERKNELLAEENARVLYVALTRAMQTVTIVWERNSRRKDGQADARSWAALIPFAIEEGEHETEHYRYRVRTAPGAPEVWQPEERKASEVPAPVLAGPRPSKPSVSPTDLLADLEAATVEERRPTAESGTRGLRIAQRGTDAHRLFENLKYGSPEHMMAMAPDEDLREAVRWVRAVEDPPLYRLIHDGEVEWGFAVRENGTILQGQIDLWGMVDDVAWLVDYKTGSMEYADKALDQLTIYAWALVKMKRVRPDQEVRLVAVYPVEKKTKARVVARASDLVPQWERLLPFISKRPS